MANCIGEGEERRKSYLLIQRAREGKAAAAAVDCSSFDLAPRAPMLPQIPITKIL